MPLPIQRLALVAFVGCACIFGVSASCAPQNVSCVAWENAQATGPCERRFRTALVGAGSFAKKAHLPSFLNDVSDCFELLAIWSRSKASAEELVSLASVVQQGDTAVLAPKAFWGSHGWKQLLASSNIEVIDIVLPISVQHSFVDEALAHGFSVVSEKPLAPTSERGRQLIASAAAASKIAAGAHWFVAENWRFEESFRVAGTLLEAGAIGAVIAFAATSLTEVPSDSPYLKEGSWRTSEDGNWIIDVGVHMVAAMRLVLGEGVQVHGVSTSTVRPEIRPFDTFAAALKLLGPSGAPGTWLFSLSSPRLAPPELPGISDLELRVTGTRGSLIATRGRVELRGRDGNLLDQVGGLRSLSVASALRCAARTMLGGVSLVGSGHVCGTGVDASPLQASADLEVIEEILRRVRAGMASTSNSERKDNYQEL